MIELPEIVERGIVLIHVGFGLVALVVAPLAMAVAKGGAAHRRWGMIFVRAMAVVLLSAGLLLLIEPTVFLAMITILSAYACFSGYRVLRRKRPERGDRASGLDRAAARLALAAGLSFIAWGVGKELGFWNANWPAGFGFIGIGFGFFLAQDGRSDLREFAHPPNKTGHWWIFHMSRMMGAYTAMLTAFAVNVLTRFMPQGWAWLPWVVPLVVMLPLITLWVRRYEQRFAKADAAKAGRRPAALEAGAPDGLAAD